MDTKMETLIQKDVDIDLGRVCLKGILTLPESPSGIVVFSHGSGSSRLSTRNTFVARSLASQGLATLLFDLLTEQEDLTYSNRFDIELLTRRLVGVTHWLWQERETALLPTGYFGASTGAASALKAAAQLGSRISAVVSRGGRPDLAGIHDLNRVVSPVLLIVGGLDSEVITLNKMAFAEINCTKQLEIVKGASHLFGEPGKLQEVTALSMAWFKEYLNS